ncbi:hypothetical protein ALP94_00581 [Pseudomonas savastanoi pv. glycinea]|uniref:DUF4123 domain-containing protein n=1 Tax=Pseudomonas sp. ICMP 561 TaxID=1718918 RepID=UPI000C071869|nr:DUF4123 domain-containing protein [Pseudomonas sp. ICMP 561]MCQ2994126.1 DUF4123 domain-containing protein [Pseudomonas syringae]RMR06079.1 hypothetical protein ALP94_00581 [Pseudomonas savastanoi pv. glycinea]
MNTWLLLERTNSVLPQLYRKIGAPQLSMLFDTTELAAYTEQSPILVTTDESSDLLNAVQQTPEDWPGLIIQSEQPTVVVLAHLRQILLVRFEALGRGVLRYSNPVTASYFFPACQSDSLKYWLGPISRLSWYGGTWGDRALNARSWRSLESPEGENREPLAFEFALDSHQQQALRCQQQDHFLYRWWLKQSDLCYSHGQQWLGEGLRYGFTKAHSLERYLDVRRDHPSPEVPQELPKGSDETRFAYLLQHLQKISTGQEN